MYIDKRVSQVIDHHIKALNAADGSLEERTSTKQRDLLIRTLGKDQILVVVNGLRRLCDGTK